MKKTLIVLMVLLLGVVLAGCTATGPSTGEAKKFISAGDGGGGTAKATSQPKFIYAAKQLNSYLFSNNSNGAQEIGFDLNVDTGGLTNTQLPYLYKGTINYTYNGTPYSTTEREAILLTVNALFDTGSGAKKLAARISAGTYAYDINFGTGESSGIPYPFVEGAGNSIPIVFFGKNYYVTRIDANGSAITIVLRESNGTGTVTLRQEKGYPYDPKATAPYNWIVRISRNANKITGIKIANSQRRWDTDATELEVFTGSNVATLAEGNTNQYITNVKFDGFRNTNTTAVRIGNQLLQYKDSLEHDHNVVLVAKTPFFPNQWSTFVIDGKTIEFKIDTETNDLNLMEYESGANIWLGKYTDLAVSENTIQFPGSNYSLYGYRFLVDEVNGSFWILMAKQSITTQYNKIVEFAGTDTKESPTKNTDKDYYLPDEIEFGNNPSDANYLVAIFRVKEVENGSVIGDTNVYIDTKYGNGNLIQLPNFNLQNYNYQADYNVQAVYPNSIVLWLRSDAGMSYYSKAWSDFGSILEVKDGVFTQIIPKERNIISITVFNSVCGNRTCELGENNSNCPNDCTTAVTPFCGNKVCESGETSVNCLTDCPPTPIEG